MSDWPASAEELIARQHELAALNPPRWTPAAGAGVAGCVVCFPRRGEDVNRPWMPLFLEGASFRA